MTEINEIRMFPLTDDPDCSSRIKLKKYLTKKLPETQEGRFYYPNNPGIEEFKENTLVLFRYEAEIIGCGIATGVNKEDEKTENGREYNGYFQFIPESIKYFPSKPITKDDIIYSTNIERMSQGKQIIDLEYLKEIKRLLKQRKIRI